MSQVVIGTAGHIDHGKTALVKALTGIDTDTLSEEKSRGMTIDLGFAYLDQFITIIDVPGHEKFIRNMVAGVSTIHIGLIAIAADDGIMPQTREHLHILELLGVNRAIVAITKTDLIDDPDWIDLVELEARELISSVFINKVNIIRTSVTTGDGLSQLKKVIIDESQTINADGNRGFFRLPVDRVFSKTGFGTIVTGTVLSGDIKTNQELEIIPGSFKVKVRGLQSHRNESSSLQMGERAAVNLSGPELSVLHRGTMIAEPGWIKSTKKIIARVSIINDTRWKLKNNQRVHLHIGTAEVIAKAIIFGDPIEKGQSANVLFILEKPVAAIMDERFIIRSFSPMETIGGCIVLDPEPIPTKKQLKKWTNDLDLIPSKRLKQFISFYWNKPKSIDVWAHYFHTNESQIKQWVIEEEIQTHNGLLFTQEKFEYSTQIVNEAMKRFHSENPYKDYVSKEQLRDEVDFSEDWLSYAVESMANNVVNLKRGYALKDHSISLSNSDLQLTLKLEELLIKAAYNIPKVDSLFSDDPKKALSLLHLLKNNGKVIEIKQGLWIHINLIDKLKHALSEYFSSSREMKVSDFKKITLSSRRSAIPLLEYCDDQSLTERQGDIRVKGDGLD